MSSGFSLEATGPAPIEPANPWTLSQQRSFSAKLRRLSLFPAHSITIKLGIAQALHAWRTTRAMRELKSLGFERLLTNRSDEALVQDPADLMYLYRAMRRGAPDRVIEFGSGQSTIFIAQGLHDRGGGHLWSLDANADWLAHTEQMLPEHLRPYVTLVHSPVVINREYGVSAWQYTVIPEGKWDFVFLDGPAGTPEAVLSCDLIKLLPALNPGASGFIDHRWRTVVLAKEVLGNRLSLRYRPSLESFAFKLEGRAVRAH